MKDNMVSQGERSASAPLQCHKPPPHRILVVDDEPSIREISSAILAGSGYQVDVAENGEDGWEALQAKNYDLLISDINMPKVSGVELVRKLRSEDAALPVILVSGALLAEELNRRPWLPLVATLLKPFTGDELLDTVKKVLHTTDTAREQIGPLPIWQSQPSRIPFERKEIK